ncbi:MAG: molybdopterin-synthase adenylyltransferase [Thermosipho sp. (in: thermotogales)]|nr:molybdopterin-synthase adenylyltransferase [Thermosipho sp. (in: thermotogales)]MDN5324909.1 molybdopterin-synthase adenylyltransferase [Thermosipho sp. (in: thermotogales)]
MLDISRHINLVKNILDKLNYSRILVVGAGGLGTVVLENLVRLGFKNIIIYDYKEIDPPDLNRQILYDSEDIGKIKVSISKEKLLNINPLCNIEVFNEQINKNTNFDQEIDLIFDCVDNIETKFILDEIAQKFKIPLIHAAVEEFRGQITVIYPGKTKTLRDIFLGYTSRQCIQVLPPSVFIAASLQVSEAIKILSNDFENSLINKILFFDILHNEFEIINL